MFTIDTTTPTPAIQPMLDTEPLMDWLKPSLDCTNLRDAWLEKWLDHSFRDAATASSTRQQSAKESGQSSPTSSQTRSSTCSRTSTWRDADEVSWDSWTRSYVGAVVAGTIVRLRRVPRDEARKYLQAIMAGEEPHNPSRTWARNLTPAQVLSISVLFQAACLGWLDAAKGVVEKADPESPRWRESYLDLLHRADDLASVRWVLATVGQADTADFALDLVYEQGRQVVRTLPSMPSLGYDERLYRAVLADPSAWWGQPVFDAGLLVQFDSET